MQRGGARSKVGGAIEGVKEKVGEALGDDDDDGDAPRERQPVRRKRSRGDGDDAE